MRRPLLAAALLLLIAGLIGLGVWQMQRRTWKLALIAQVERRLAAPPVPAPGPDRWPGIGKDDAYTRLSLHGSFRPTAPVLTQAVTDYGSGYWVIAPFDDGRGFTVLVNRGFVPQDGPKSLPAPTGPRRVTGLLRISEPGGGFLRVNRPAEDRWYSRDVSAIARARGWGTVAPYFIDASADGKAGWPRGGLTVIRFANNHLVYALTWFGLAALLAFMTVRVAIRRPTR